MRRVLSVVLLSTVCAMNVPMQAAQAAASITYPQTRKTDLVENEFGTPVADPYRWLENDVRNDPEVASWVAAENQVTDRFLHTLPLLLGVARLRRARRAHHARHVDDRAPATARRSRAAAMTALGRTVSRA